MPQNKPTLCVVTPTYNRAYILDACYRSLQRQTCSDFMWMIIDDGSVDGTEELVSQWQKENKVEISYFKTENRGKPSALNLSMDQCQCALWVCVDSDDYLSDTAVECILREYRTIQSDDTCGGLIANMHDFDGNILGGKSFPKEYEYIVNRDIRYKAKMDVDLVRVFKSRLLCRPENRYPIFENEKYIGESYLYEKINTKYHIVRAPLYYAEYRDDGLTANYLKLHVDNPLGYKLLKEQVITLRIPLLHRCKAAASYVAACMLNKEKGIVKHSPAKLLTAATYPLGVIIYYKRYHKLVKEKRRNTL